MIYRSAKSKGDWQSRFKARRECVEFRRVRVLGATGLPIGFGAASAAGIRRALAEGAGEQAASLEETSSSLEEMSGMIKRNAENAAITIAPRNPQGKVSLCYFTPDHELKLEKIFPCP